MQTFFIGILVLYSIEYLQCVNGFYNCSESFHPSGINSPGITIGSITSVSDSITPALIKSCKLPLWESEDSIISGKYVFLISPLSIKDNRILISCRIFKGFTISINDINVLYINYLILFSQPHNSFYHKF